MCESSKKPFWEVLHRQHCWVKGKHSIGGEDIVSDEVFHSGKIWDRLSLLQAFILTYFAILRYPSERRQHISEQKPSWWIEKLTPYDCLKPCSEEQWSRRNNGCPSWFDLLLDLLHEHIHLLWQRRVCQFSAFLFLWPLSRLKED